MHRTTPRARNHRGRTLALALAAVLVLSAAAVPMALAQGRATVAREARAPKLHKTVLTDTKGLTLYSLSVEKNGRFVCTGSCTSTWFPLLVPAGTRPIGPVKLGTIRRPEGKIQVTFEGLPLYTFDGDRAKGQANGQGFRDVGVWHAVTP